MMIHPRAAREEPRSRRCIEFPSPTPCCRLGIQARKCDIVTRFTNKISPREEWSTLLRITRQSIVEQFATRTRRHCETITTRAGLPQGYVSRQFRLHAPAMSSQEITASSEQAACALEIRLGDRFRQTADVHRQLAREIGPTAPISGKLFQAGRLHFRPVTDNLGQRLQREIHYLHCERSDNVAHIGAFPAGSAIPVLCLSYSFCDREYLLDALTSCMPARSTHRSSLTNILVLTRAVSTVPIQKNLMSSLIAWSFRGLRRRFNTILCITAVNPFLGFDGAAFRAAGFAPFALSPMTYQYNEHGLYVTRRAAKAPLVDQMMPTPPIVWMFRWLTPRNVAPSDYRLVSITSSAYLNSESRECRWIEHPVSKKRAAPSTNQPSKH
jgi:hypothetical protein